MSWPLDTLRLMVMAMFTIPYSIREGIMGIGGNIGQKDITSFF